MCEKHATYLIIQAVEVSVRYDQSCLPAMENADREAYIWKVRYTHSGDTFRIASISFATPFIRRMLAAGILTCTSLRASLCRSQNAGNEALLSCSVTLNITEDMPPPLYIFYEVRGLYQNHRRYVASSLRRSPFKLGSCMHPSSASEVYVWRAGSANASSATQGELTVYACG